MLLSVAAGHSEDRRRLGLQTLIDVVDARGGGNRNVATRTIAASRRAVCLGGERDPEPVAEGDEEGGGEEEEEEEGGCWVMYGWRRRLRRLPPLIPSLRRAGSSPWALTRTHTADGRVVITREPAPLRGRVVATRLDGRLILDLVDSSPAPPPPRQLRTTHPSTSIAQETDASDDDEVPAGCADVGSARRNVPAAVIVASASASPVGSASASPAPAVGCFEAVIRTSPLRKNMPVSLPRMVH